MQDRSREGGATLKEILRILDFNAKNGIREHYIPITKWHSIDDTLKVVNLCTASKVYTHFLAFWSIFSFDYTVCKMLKPQTPRLLVVHPLSENLATVLICNIKIKDILLCQYAIYEPYITFWPRKISIIDKYCYLIH
jgi:hypothetical protein